MALGGGTFTAQNKVLPGAYINFVSAGSGITLSERGTVAVGLELGWLTKGEVYEVETYRIPHLSMEYFGYPLDAPEMMPIRELSKNASKIIFSKLNGGTKASNKFAEALHEGTVGNDFSIRIQANADENDKFDVQTLYKTQVYDTQTVKEVADLVDNQWVKWKKEAVLEVTAATPLANGSDEKVTGEDQADFLKLMTSQPFNVLVCGSDDEDTKKVYAEYTKRMRDDVGRKFQTVIHDYAADYEGVVNVKNAPDLVYWVGGALAGCRVEASTMNMVYDGELSDFPIDFSQFELEDTIRNGEYTFHREGKDIRVLMDINSLTTETEEKGEVFKYNQTIRVIDQIANDIGAIFKANYIGKIPNDESGRISLWNDIVKIHDQLAKLRAITDFDSSDITVEQGATSDSVYVTEEITVMHAMAKLYMVVAVA